MGVKHDTNIETTVYDKAYQSQDFYFDDGTEDILQLPFKNLPGSHLNELYNWSIPIPLTSNIDSPNVLLYIQQSIRKDPSNYKELNKCPSNINSDIWLCELFRQMIIELNDLVLMLSQYCKADNPNCSKMIATSTYEFRCAAHSPPKQCSAIDYMLHTLDNVTNILNSGKIYIDRNKPSKSCKRDLGTLDRRLYRLYAHSYYHHKNEFIPFEKKHFIYRRFINMTTMYSLATPDQILPKIPENAFD